VFLNGGPVSHSAKKESTDVQLDATFPDPGHSETDRCLRIYASGTSDTTFPFLHELYRRCDTATRTSFSAERSTVGDDSPSPRQIWEYCQVAQLAVGGTIRVTTWTVTVKGGGVLLRCFSACFSWSDRVPWRELPGVLKIILMSHKTQNEVLARSR
jgi:hypothetical protein